MNTCANCRHWRPHAGSPTTMICGRIRSASNASPRIILDIKRQKPANYPMVLATPSSFGCSLHEDQPPRGERPQDRA